MAKYTLNSYGWSMEAVGKSLTDEQVEQIKSKMEELGYTELYEIRHELDEFGIDIWDGDLFHTTRGSDNGTMFFEVEDENGNKVVEFGIEDTLDIYDMIEDFDENYSYTDYNGFPQEDEPKNVYVSIDESKGGISTYEFECDEVPTAKDFATVRGSVATPDGDWDFIDKIFFKGQELEVYDWLDSTGKGSTTTIYLPNEETIS